MFKKIVFFDALSEEAKEKAREWFRAGNDMPDLEEYLKEFLTEELEEREYKVKELKPLYSLSNCQGDGVSFEATLERNGGRYFVTQSGRYVHEMSMSMTCESLEDFAPVDCDFELEEMREVARLAEKAGYEYIDLENENEHVDEEIRLNEYTFSIEGERMNPDNA